jgi:hypothetical protein
MKPGFRGRERERTFLPANGWIDFSILPCRAMPLAFTVHAPTAAFCGNASAVDFPVNAD